MRLRLSILAFAAAGVLTAGPLFAGLEGKCVLEAQDYAALSERAKAAFDEAAFLEDRAAYDTAAKLLAQAAEAAPDIVDLQFLALRRLIARAEVSWDTESIEYYDMADAVAKRLLNTPTLTAEQRDRALRADEKINGRPAVEGRSATPGERNAVLERDVKRSQTGLKLMVNIRDKRRELRGLTISANQASGFLPGENAEDKKKKANETPKLDPFAPLPGEERPKLPQAQPGQPMQPGGAINPFQNGGGDPPGT